MDGGSAYQKRFSVFFQFPDQPVPENRMLPFRANPWAKRSPMTPQSCRSVQPFRQLALDITPILIRFILANGCLHFLQADASATYFAKVITGSVPSTCVQ